ncbi:tRNA (32-2'-O)-methyltransferase regulator THADA-like [Palaemon carinicauda]|uniref:tRNA (32-2'-O)-methyltransferase regulator THADA-like n=1 Tax=Palaemon carinicauda TaxID=392227 RepID=UPI0035B69A6A
MEANVSEILDRLFSQSVDRDIRTLKKTIEDLPPPSQYLLASEVVQKLRQYLKDDSATALFYVCALSSGCQLLQQCVVDCLPVVINCCISGMHPSMMKNDISRFRVSSKAAYGVLQILSSKTDTPLENSSTNLLQQLFELLLFAVADENLPTDCAIILGTSLCLAFTVLVKEDLPRKFYQLLKVIAMYDQHRDKEGARESISKLHSTHGDGDTCLSVNCLETSFSVVKTIFGLLNCGVLWIYSVEHYPKQTETHEFLKENMEPCQRVGISQNKGALPMEPKHSKTSLSEGCDDGIIKDEKGRVTANVFLYGLGSIIRKICRVPSSYSFQAFQALLFWLQNVRKVVKRYKEEHGLERLSELCITPSKQAQFAINAENPASVFHLLNSNWESPSKGVPDLVHSAMIELFQLHEEEAPGRSQELALQMVANLVSVDAWNLKSTYPPLSLAVLFAGSKIILEKYPAIPEGLYKSLKVNYLAPPGANVYKLIVKDVTPDVWSEHFLDVLVKALHSTDRVVRQNALTLWLPPTVQRYPYIHNTLLDKCIQLSAEGWLARMAVLKVARVYGSVDIDENMKFSILKEEDDDPYCLGVKKKAKNYCDVESVPFLTAIRYTISHADEMVRSEALTFLCRTKKSSQPVTQMESELLKEFFTLNMNIDSAPFRQNVISGYKYLIVRLRDSCVTVLKSPPYKNVRITEEFVDLNFKNLCATSTLYVNGELLIWFLTMIHSNLLPGSNYQRRILSLELYKETLLAFYERHNGAEYTVSRRFMPVCSFVNSFSKTILQNTSDESKSVVDFTLPWTFELLLLCSLDEMDDIRDNVEKILEILEYFRARPHEEVVRKWLPLGLSLCNSSKSSNVESGASILKIMLIHSDQNIPSILQEYGDFEEPGNLLTFLYDQVETQFRGAQSNMLTAAREAPIHGSLLALGRCLCENNSSVSEPAEDLQKPLKQLLELMVEMVEFMLSVLAMSSKNGSAVAPSFAEMGESIEMMIKKCKTSLEGKLPEASEETEAAALESLTDSLGEDADETYESETAISSDHALVLACCWQVMKVCCLVSSECASRWMELLTEHQIEMILRSIIVRVLTGTRHKGAMEAARTCYSQLCVLLLRPYSKYGHLIYRQVDDILNNLKGGANTSITRRAAGMAMMVQAACGASPRNNKTLIDTTVRRLMEIIETEYEEQNTMDYPPVLALHILHSLVLNASLAHNLVQHMPSITMTCLKAFTSDSWALRNAALQLYGAVVPRMVGQKKVRDDSSTLNSLTASEFLSRHYELADYLLQLLQNNKNIGKLQEKLKSSEVSKSIKINQDTIACAKDLKNNNDFNNWTFSSPLTEHSHLVPVLSLLARLSPGTGIQKSQKLNERLSKYYNVTFLLLGSPIHTIRRLSALSLVALTPCEQAVVMVKRIISSLGNERSSANEVHGKLLTIIEFLDTYPNLITDDNVRVPLVSLALMILESTNACYVTANAALKIVKVLNVETCDVNLDAIDIFKPGAPQFVLTATKLGIVRFSEEEKEKFVMKNILYTQVLEESFLTFLEGYIENTTSEKWMERVETAIWQRLEDSGSLKSPVLVRVLYVILNKQNRISQFPLEQGMENLLTLLQGFCGAKISSKVLTVIAFIIKYLCSVDQFDSPLTCRIVRIFCSVVRKYSNPTSTEDYRLEASTALSVAFPSLFSCQMCANITTNEQLVFAVLDLVQDEDSLIRDASCQIVLQLQKYSLSHLLYLYPESCLKNQIDKLVHPNLALKYFIEIVTTHSIHHNDWELLRSIWRSQYEDIKSEHKPKLSLFQSQSVNLYSEQKHCGTQIRKAFERVIRDYVNQTSERTDKPIAKDALSEWVLGEYEELEKRSKELMDSLKTGEDRLTDRRYLVAELICIKAQETLSSISDNINIELDFNFSHSLPLKDRKYYWLNL